MANSLVFNNINLGDYGLIITSSDVNQLRKRGSYIRIKDYSITGQSTREPRLIWSKIAITASSRSDLNDNLDSIKLALDQNTNKEIVFDCLNDRYFNAKLERFDGRYVSPLIFQGDIQFMCSDPFGYSTTETSSTHTIDADPKEVTETTTGSAFIRPVFTFTATGAIGATTFTLENTNTTEELIWTDTINNTEVLIINSENWHVSLEGAASMTNVSGQFPTLLPNQSNTIRVTGGNSGTLNIKYRMRFL